MKKLLIILLFSPFFLFGFSNLLINNSATPSVIVNDSLKITGNFQGGDTSAIVKFYYDANQNFTLDSGDKLVTFYMIYDGSPYDEDEVQNSYYSSYIPSIPSPMYTFILAEDSGGSDTIPLLVNHLQSSVTISGNVTSGGNPADKVFVLAVNDGNNYGAFTGTDGSYKIYLPDSIVGDTMDLIFIDFIGNNPGYLGCLDTLILTGDDTMNAQLTLNDGTTLSGYILDNMGDTLKDTIDFFIGGGYLNGTVIKSLTAQTFATNGSYSMSLVKGTYFSDWQIDYSFISDMYYPLYSARKDTSLIITGNTNFNIVLYKNDSDIKGHVYVNGNGADAFEIECSATSDTTVGDMNTITYSDGRYILPVSSASDSYRVFVNVPDGYICDTPMVYAACGDTGINFYLTQTGIETETNVNSSDIRVKLINGKLFISGVYGKNSSISIYNIIGRKLFSRNVTAKSMTFNLNLDKGIYFAVIRNGNNLIRKKLINLK